MRVVTGAICHETSTFTPVATTWESYRNERFGYLHGDEIFTKFRGTNTPIGGFLDGAEKHGFELIPTVFANAHPSGPTPREIFDTILGDLLDGIVAAGAIDGILLELHGAMVAEGINDGEDFLLDKSILDETIYIKTKDAIARAKKLAKENGLLVGISAGANVLAAERWVAENNPEHPVVTILCDRGERYFSCYED